MAFPGDLLPDWTDLHYFLELARAGTLSGSARRLGVEHTTVARRIQRLEEQLKTPLFDRRREGYRLTDIGQALLPHAEAMESAMLAAAEQVGGTHGAARGRVRIGAPEVFGTLVIANHLAALLEANPELHLDLLLLPRMANLANREADLVVTLEPPETGRYVVSRLVSVRYYLYAAPSYLGRHGPIRSRDELSRHAFVGYVEDWMLSSGLNFIDELGVVPERRFCCTGMLAQYQAALSGVGLILMPPYAAVDGRLVPVLADSFYAEREFWLVTPADLFKLQRVRVVWDYLRRIAEDEPRLFIR